MPSSYTEAMGSYLAREAEAAAELEALQAEYESERARLQHEVDRARERREVSELAAAEAENLKTDVDRRSTRLWADLAAFVGTQHCGTFPAKTAPSSDEEPRPDDIAAQMDDAERTLRSARRGEVPIEPPRLSYIVAALFGVLCASGGVRLAVLLLAGGDISHRAGASLALIAPVAVAPMLWGVWQGWVYRVRPRPLGVLLSVCCAAAAVAVGAVVFLRGF
ncbi:hypothetical protein [Salininema proteolyticum]|uniref:Uncharacterized protein n=1 Tax=Salininema proteolyticum TaxID=1607685 RepID=A0ABV8TZM5_9ACTN